MHGCVYVRVHVRAHDVLCVHACVRVRARVCVFVTTACTNTPPSRLLEASSYRDDDSSLVKVVSTVTLGRAEAQTPMFVDTLTHTHTRARAQEEPKKNAAPANKKMKMMMKKKKVPAKVCVTFRTILMISGHSIPWLYLTIPRNSTRSRACPGRIKS